MPFLELLIIVVLILINGVLAMSELAIASSRQARLKIMAENGVRGARRALALASDPGKFLSTVQIGITLTGILAGAYSGATLGDRFAAWLESNGVSDGVAEPLAFGLVITGITYLSLVAGELVPKQIALRNAERIACLVAPAMTLLARVALPVVWVLDRSGRLVLRLLGLHGSGDATVTDAEIHALVAEAESAGVLEPGERELITGVMRLGDRPVRAVMTPRANVTTIDLNDPPAKIRKAIRTSVHSRFPVRDGPDGDIVGVIQAKDLLNQTLSGRNAGIKSLLRKAPIIPDTMDAIDVVPILKASEVHVGLVHNEYGDFEGLVTSADILEAIAGAFTHETDAPEPGVVRREDGSFLIAGSLPVEQLGEITRIALPEKRDYQTLAGFVIDQLGRLPATGECLDYHGWRFEVVDLDNRRIDKLLVSKRE